ncbi:MAG: hypothetical protein MUP99_14535 [Pedobacter sp.]|nr:hypothetical protein [Pedobacter sp.]
MYFMVPLKMCDSDEDNCADQPLLEKAPAIKEYERYWFERNGGIQEKPHSFL